MYFYLVLDGHLLAVEALNAPLQVMQRKIRTHATSAHVFAKIALDAQI